MLTSRGLTTRLLKSSCSLGGSNLLFCQTGGQAASPRSEEDSPNRLQVAWACSLAGDLRTFNSNYQMMFPAMLVVLLSVAQFEYCLLVPTAGFYCCACRLHLHEAPSFRAFKGGGLR